MPAKNKVCVMCGAEFTPVHGEISCSVACQDKRIREWKNARKPKKKIRYMSNDNMYRSYK